MSDTTSDVATGGAADAPPTPPATPSPTPWPTELRFQRAEKRLRIGFEDGKTYDIPFELLRVESPSAEVQGHGPGDKTLVVNKGDVGVVSAERVGHYAVRIVFDDGHDSGLFTWAYLRGLGENAAALLADYRARLAELGRA